MNYKAELRGFALDRVIKIEELSKNSTSYFDILQKADSIVDYLYIPEKDIQSHLNSLIPLIQKSGELGKLEDLILELQQIAAEMKAGINSAVN